jgi:ribonuclease VapC
VIVVDTSALLAILFDEPEAHAYRDYLAHAPQKAASSVSLLEAGIVVSARLGPSGLDALAKLVEDADIEIVSFDRDQSEQAIQAFQLYGKGRHRAQLNICDCAAYALAKGLNAPLLYKGNDFAATDIVTALP